MDEATTALDVVTQGQILMEIRKLEREMPITRVMITHDLSVVATSCKKIIVMYAGRLMEYGMVREVLVDPKHPYTRGLVRSFPSLHGEKTALEPIPGAFPDLANLPSGCVFAPRCPDAMPCCGRETPPDTYLSDTHKVSCHLYRGGDRS
jgi:peptide/nickel transport system ATP-binding protein